MPIPNLDEKKAKTRSGWTKTFDNN